MKRGIKCIILIFMIAIIGGCSSNNKKNNTNSDLEKQSKINIEDIDWKVRQGIVDGNRYALLDYTNNTPYMITHFELTFGILGTPGKVILLPIAKSPRLSALTPTTSSGINFSD